MIDHQDYIDAWGIDKVFEYPRAEWISEYSAPPEVYPDVDFIPTDMSLFFTSYLEGGRFHLYDRINLRVEDDEYMPLVIVGAIPAEPDSMLFCFEGNDGRVVLLGADSGTLELVNSTFRSLTVFLYHFGRFIDADTGIDSRAQRATSLLEDLRAIDGAAFKDPASWWTVVLAQLGATV
ncbi:SUKH-4 family immunity protein [Nocardia sp. NPDC055321]